MLRYLPVHRLRLAVIFGSMAVFTATLVAIPWFVKLIIDGYIATADADLSGLDSLALVFGRSSWSTTSAITSTTGAWWSWDSGCSARSGRTSSRT